MTADGSPSCIDCGHPLIDVHRSDQVRCKDCAHERAMALARRRQVLKRVGEADLEGALLLQEAKREALKEKRLWLQARYAAYDERRRERR